MFFKMLFHLFFILISFKTITMAANDESELKVLQSNGLFTNKLYKILSEKDGNVFFSPISAHTVLAMSYMGSDGTTKKAYETSLNLPGPQLTANGYKAITTNLNNVPNVTLLIANKVYLHHERALKKEFQTTIVDKFNSEIQSVNFGDNVNTAKLINQWVEDKTNKKIKDLISADSLNGLTRLVLVNAIYFKGNWLEKFEKRLTRTEPFYLNDKDTIDVQMMHMKKKFNFKYDEKLNAKIIELPYENKDVSLVVVLPNERDGIKDLEKKLENQDLTKLLENSWKTEVELALPKFKIETTIPLEEPLAKMGLGEIFDASKANFTNLIDGNEELHVSKVIQKAFIEVNEEGAEAAAATGFIIHALSAPKETYFLADHPFLFFIKIKKLIIFNGKCVEPKFEGENLAPKGVPVRDPFARNIYINLEE